MQYCLFISDLHLCDSRPHITRAFISFLEKIALNAQSLYILGDLFEYWPGDDAIATGMHQEVIAALSALTNNQVNVFLMHGNRDFLLSDGFASATNITMLADPSLITLYGKPVLLSHGDALCTDDVAYQQFRAEVRNSAWQAQFLSQSLANRIAYIERLRTSSERAKLTKTMKIMDVNIAAVENLLRAHAQPPIFIHGHTHRPNTHIHLLDGYRCERWVLGDWYEQGSYLTLNKNGCYSHML